MPEHNKQTDDRPMLVTGSVRSGTTWVGKMLAAAPGVAYVDEPFRPDQRPGVFDAGIERWFSYAPDADEERIRAELDRLLECRYALSAEIGAVRSLKDFLRMARDASRFARHRLFASRVLLKDPLAVFSSAWIARVTGSRVVVMVRHPAAVALSLKRRGWEQPFGDLLEQDKLMEEQLAPFRRDIERFSRGSRPIVEQAGLLWAAIYNTIQVYLEEHPNWIVLRHEDVARAPLETFRKIYDHLELEFTASVRRAVRRSSRSDNPVEPQERAKDVHRDSRNLVGRWREELSRDEIESVRSWTSEVGRRWYRF